MADVFKKNFLEKKKVKLTRRYISSGLYELALRRMSCVLRKMSIAYREISFLHKEISIEGDKISKKRGELNTKQSSIPHINFKSEVKVITVVTVEK